MISDIKWSRLSLSSNHNIGHNPNFPIPKLLSKLTTSKFELSPEQATTHTVNKETQGRVQGQEKAGDIGEYDKPKWRIEAGDISIVGDGVDWVEVFLFEVGHVVEHEHVLKLDQVEDGTWQAAEEKNGHNNEQNLTLVAIIWK